MKVVFIKNCTVELEDKSAGLFRVGLIADLDNEIARTLVKRGYATKSQ